MKKNIALNVTSLDRFVRELWKNDPNFIDKCNSKNPPFYATTTSYNWYGFIERINEVILNPEWSQIKEFVEHYCSKRNLESSSYIILYEKLDKMGYSSVFKTSIMNSFYLEENSISTKDPFYIEIFSFFKKYQ